jgi:hypothetical protein
MNMNMNNISKKMMNQFFRQVDNVVWDMFTGRVGVQTADGIVTIEGEGEDAQVAINLMDQFGMPVPAFAQNTPLQAVAVGDLIYQGNSLKGWVTEVVRSANTVVPSAVEGEADTIVPGEVKRFKMMTPGGVSNTWTPPKVSMLGFDSGVMVLRSLMNMLPDGKAGLNNMQGMLMPMMMMGGDMDFEKIMPMMLMSQLGANGDGSDAMGMQNMMPMMMMMGMMGGKGGKGNGIGNFFENDR